MWIEHPPPPTAVHSHSQSHHQFTGRRFLTRSASDTNRSFTRIHNHIKYSPIVTHPLELVH